LIGHYVGTLVSRNRGFRKLKIGLFVGVQARGSEPLQIKNKKARQRKRSEARRENRQMKDRFKGIEGKVALVYCQEKQWASSFRFTRDLRES